MLKFDHLKLLDNNKVELDGEVLDVVVGKHCIWIPGKEIKFIISLNGMVESTAWRRGRNADAIHNKTYKDKRKNLNEAWYSMKEEHFIFHMLASEDMSPMVNRYVKVKNFTSSIFYDNYCDTYGIWGYEMENANKLPAGKWSLEKFKELFIDTGRITASPGALGDLKKPDNTVNSRLVDIRRTKWDMMRGVSNEPTRENS